ncbi:lysophospholipid acyltransferase family protein [Paramaledivibacter caminithermalis]|jgi:1-acyl-sn-glycerol-3-phosphate acyltransferase|uniref:1-acyl-sn-glycerol-3-phosphate acyltransferase n=1 Tax=Paramaledivibacter caminithermalis (strain DSM 15212 / CIP 107654 / DViRD3) TaxID=1121301 RepID=A0A1M6P949_PARC5|nr:1-acyl-sn-glycerol-3-phosphate acyltransferase [Paramaledivibacter caminithermalis]SHK04402.1 1-acyl-sn-glycerol-3-phosphate acyltransferase [Paramaledivibacter caminithermalis DSM 15212]
MFRTIIWVIYFIFRVLVITPYLIILKYLDKKNRIEERNKLAYRIARNWGRDLMKVSGSQIRVIGEENIPKDRAVLFVSNHQSYLDIPILLGFIDKPKAFIAKAELEKYPIFSTWMKTLKCIFINRDDVRQSLRAIKEGIKLLKAGYSLVIFPEGTRSKDGKLREFKQGSLKLATKSGAPIVPVTIKGAKDIMPRGTLFIKPANVEVIISKPIFMEEDIAKDSKALNERVRNIIGEKLNND